MKKSILVFSLFFISFLLKAQDKDMGEILNRNVIDCYDVVNNSLNLLPDYYKEGKMDTVQMIIDYWQENCGPGERLQRIIILKAIDENSFSEDLYDQNIINLLLQYKGSMNTFYSYSTFYPVGGIQKFDNFTRELANELGDRKNMEPLEKFFADYYSDTYMLEFKRLYQPEFNGTSLQAYYLEEIRKYSNFGTFGYYLAGGVWSPTGNLSKLGVHPRASFGMGYYNPSTTVMLDFGIGFLKTPTHYDVVYEDSLFSTKRFTNLYLGLTAGQKIFGSAKSKFSLLGGFGYEGIGTIKINDETDCDCEVAETHYLNSINLNLGLGVQFYLNEYMNLFVRSKYNFLFMDNEGGTDLSGNTITLSAGLMITGYSYEKNRLNALNYNRSKSW